MKQTRTLTMLSIALLLLIGCEKDQQSTVEILSITPADGETNVLKTVKVQVEFNESMESSSCESRFGLFQGVLESIPSNMMGSMEGEFTWNDDHTMMTFHSDSMLMDSTMYSICLEEGMMAEDMMGDGMMMSNMNDHGMETAKRYYFQILQLEILVFLALYLSIRSMDQPALMKTQKFKLNL